MRNEWKLAITFLISIILLSACSAPAPITHVEKIIKSVPSVNKEFTAIIEESDVEQGTAIFPPLYTIYITKKSDDERHPMASIYGCKELPTLTWTNSHILNITYGSGSFVHYSDSLFKNTDDRIRTNLRYIAAKDSNSVSNKEKILPELVYDESIGDKIENALGDLLHFIITKNTELLRIPSPDKQQDAVLVKSDSGGAGERYFLYITSHNSKHFTEPNMEAYELNDKLPTITWDGPAQINIHYSEGWIGDFNDSVWDKNHDTQTRKVRLNLFRDS